MMMAGPAQFLRTAWTVLREVSGDAAYENYAARDQPLLDREAFYLSELERRWSGVNRCC
ncbi:MAG: putative selenoprotein [Niveispirillum sp.]|nr:putative selenoprotein [Niveispirillum sp.]